MNHRFIAASALMSVLAVAIVAVMLNPAAVTGQAPAASTAVKTAAAAAPAASAAKPATAAKAAWTLSKTPDGQPDLQGFWSTTTNAGVPMERPANLGAKEFYTPEEFAAKGAGGRGGGAAAGANVAAAAPRGAAPGVAGGAGGAGAAAPAAAGRGGAAGGRGGARGGPVGRGGVAPPVTTNTGDIHYDTAQFGLRGGAAAVSLRTSMIVGPEGKYPPLTPEGQKRLAAYNAEQAAQREHQWDGAESRPLAERCILWNAEGPPMLMGGYNNNLQIVQSKDYVMILIEMIHDVRIIPLDGRPHVVSDVKQWLGDARGHWEGNTLVVETTNFNGRNPFRPAGGQGVAGVDMKLTERFTRTGDNTLVYQYTVDDPSWAKPWTTEVTWGQSEGPLFEYACHEGNYGMKNILLGQRASEKAGK